MFDSWLNLSPAGSTAFLPSQPNAAPATPERLSVSSPFALDPGAFQDGSEDIVETEEQKAEFEQFMVFASSKDLALSFSNEFGGTTGRIWD